MLTYIFAFGIALLVSAMSTPVVVVFAKRFGLFDLPLAGRKVHKTPIPRLGGIAVVAAFFAPILGLGLYTNEISQMMYRDAGLVMALFCGALSIVALGLYDDVWGAGAPLKLTVQIAAAIGMYLAGFRIQLLALPFGTPVQLNFLALPLTVLWIVGITNALNLIDGLDGLASGIALFASVVLFGACLVDNNVLLCVLVASLGGALLGFLFFNFNPAKIFLGDSGSMFLGFVLATISIWTQRKSATAAALLIPVFALGLPILDTTLSVVRRIGKGQSPFHPDREHLHHRLLDLGLTHRTTVITLYTASGAFALGALALLSNDGTQNAIAIASVGVVAFMLVRKAGLMRGVNLPDPYVAFRDEVRVAARSIRAADDFASAWNTLCGLLPHLGCDEFRLRICAPIALSGIDLEKGVEQVYEWHKQADLARVSAIDAGEASGKQVLRMALQEAHTQIGEMAVAMTGTSAQAGPVPALAYELVRDALIDFYIHHATSLSTLTVARDMSNMPVTIHKIPAGAPQRASQNV